MDKQNDLDHYLPFDRQIDFRRQFCDSSTSAKPLSVHLPSYASGTEYFCTSQGRSPKGRPDMVIAAAAEGLHKVQYEVACGEGSRSKIETEYFGESACAGKADTEQSESK